MENKQEERPIQRSLNKSGVLKSRVMSKEEGSGRKIRKSRKMILRIEKRKTGRCIKDRSR